MSQPQYEFNASQNQTLGSLANRMRMFGYALIMGGALQSMAMCVALVTTLGPDGQEAPHLPLAVLLAAGLLAAFLGFSLQKAAFFFQQMVETEGSDIDHLMNALARLERFFEVSGALVWALVLLLLVAFVRWMMAGVGQFPL